MGNAKSQSLEGTPHRTIVPNHTLTQSITSDQHPNHSYADNRIKTTKYSVLTFLPKNLFEQFHRIANLYFIFIVFLNWMPQVSAFGKEVAMIPVIFVLSVTAVKDAFEDYRRYRSDLGINHLKAKVYSRSDEKYTDTSWQDIRVGDIVRLACDEVIPADIVILKSSDLSCSCYIDTANLDGESNLKQRESVKGLPFQNNFHPSMFTFTIECEQPNMEIYKFNGSMVTTQGDHIPVSKNNILLRGCILRNTEFVEGIVVYAGPETKAMLNNRGPRYKRSRLECQINREVIWCVIILILMCLFCSIGTGLFLRSYGDSLSSVPFILNVPRNSAIFEAFIRFWTYIILFQVMIPLSLYVTIELIKLGQVYFITNDLDLYHDLTDSTVLCRALNITEDLGQVEVIFSDKTGTLTENQMVFKRCCINGEDYSSSATADADSTEANLDMPPGPQHHSEQMVNLTLKRKVSFMSTASLPSTPGSGFFGQWSDDHDVWDFFLLMAICNTVAVSPSSQVKTAVEKSGPPISIQDKHYQPFDGYVPELIQKSSESRGEPIGYTNPMIHAGTSDNESLDMSCSSQIGEDYGTASVTMSDSSGTAPKERPSSLPVFSLSSSKDSLDLSSDGPSVVADMDQWLNQSLASIKYEAESPDELALVKAAHVYGCTLLSRSEDRVAVRLPNGSLLQLKVLHVLQFDSTRKRMSIIIEHPVTQEIVMYSKGADSAILSRLRSSWEESMADERKVRATQHQLTEYAKCGLRTLCMARRVIPLPDYKHWVSQHLRAENALQNREELLMESASAIECDLELIGASGIEDRLQDGVPDTIRSLRLAGIDVWVLTGDKQETALNIAYSCQLISSNQNVIILNADNQEMTSNMILSKLKYIDTIRQNPSGLTSEDQKVALVVDGTTLSFALDDSLESDFLRLAQQCHSVLCCRATPHQKAAVVHLVKEKLNKLTLAIGDGANDVSMIQTADVGIGICGQEGMQAVMASDFALARFRFLRKLLLVHGHWCYDRLARMTLYMWFKNAVYIFMLLWYQFFNGFSGITMVDDYNLILFNLVFTSLPPIVLGIFDQDVSAEILFMRPKLYHQGPKNEVYKKHSYFVCLLDAIWQSLVEFFIPYFVYSGTSVGIWEFGVTCNVSCVWATLLHLCVETKYWNVFHCVVIALSLLVFYAFNLVYSVLCLTCSPPSNPYAVFSTVLQSPVHWFTLVLVIIMALLPRVIIRALQGTFWPSACIIARMWEKILAELRKIPYGSSSNDPPVLISYDQRCISTDTISTQVTT